MIFTYSALKLIWWLITAALMVGFAITGGMDIGTNILLPIVGKTNDERRLIMNSVGPTWEGNQVWLITFGATLFAIWPIVYATAFSSMYPALLIVLVMLILRPPGFDYRGKINSVLWRRVWDYCIFTSGLVLALLFGVAIGNLFSGLPFSFDSTMRLSYSGNLFTLISPLTLGFGLVSLTMFTLQGALYLQYKLEMPLAHRAKIIALKAAVLFVLAFIASGCSVVFTSSAFKIIEAPFKIIELAPSGWLSNYDKYPLLWIYPNTAVFGTLIAAMLSYFSRPVLALVFNSLAIVGTIFTAAVALFPFILPSSIKPEQSLLVWDASSSYKTLSYTLWVGIILLPIVLVYTSWVYRVMRGKVKLQTNSY